VMVPVAPLREAFLSKPITSSEVARRMGWVRPLTAADRARNRKGPRPDQTRVMRALGLRQHCCGRNGAYYYRKQTQHHTAVRLARAIGADYRDVGL
jgi:hypothetical protein